MLVEEASGEIYPYFPVVVLAVAVFGELLSLVFTAIRFDAWLDRDRFWLALRRVWLRLDDAGHCGVHEMPYRPGRGVRVQH